MNNTQNVTEPLRAATGSAWVGKQVYVHFDNWGRFCETPIRPGGMSRTELATVLKETPRRYRVRFDEDWPRGSRGDLVLVPKWAMTLATPNDKLRDGATERRPSSPET